jgi:hypothetical protein
MSGQTDPKATQERADRTADENVEAAVEGTFPASDPMATIASQGARAVPPEEMMHAGGSKPHSGDTATLTARFDSMEAAKLAVEAMVRDGPVDRRCAQVENAGGAATVRLSVPQTDRQRLGEMLQRQSGRTG